MNPVTHGLVSWIVANAPGTDRRERQAITIAGIAPDIDGFGYPVEVLTATSAQPLEWFHRFHHHLTHNALACVVFAGLAFAWTRGSWRAAGLALATASLHLLCDLVGSRGPDGNQWPLPLFQPFADGECTWSGQWPLVSWQNTVITLGAFIATIALAVRRGFSPVEIVSLSGDRRFIEILRARLGLRR